MGMHIDQARHHHPRAQVDHAVGLHRLLRRMADRADGAARVDADDDVILPADAPVGVGREQPSSDREGRLQWQRRRHAPMVPVRRYGSAPARPAWSM